MFCLASSALIPLIFSRSSIALSLSFSVSLTFLSMASKRWLRFCLSLLSFFSSSLFLSICLLRFFSVFLILSSLSLSLRSRSFLSLFCFSLSSKNFCLAWLIFFSLIASPFTFASLMIASACDFRPNLNPSTPTTSPAIREIAE